MPLAQRLLDLSATLVESLRDLSAAFSDSLRALSAARTDSLRASSAARAAFLLDSSLIVQRYRKYDDRTMAMYARVTSPTAQTRCIVCVQEGTGAAVFAQAIAMLIGDAAVVS